MTDIGNEYKWSKVPEPIYFDKFDEVLIVNSENAAFEYREMTIEEKEFFEKHPDILATRDFVERYIHKI